jgi:hypothetical protein
MLRIIDHLNARGLDEPELFLSPPDNPSQLTVLKNAFATGKGNVINLNDFELKAVAKALRALMDEKDPLFTFDNYHPIVGIQEKTSDDAVDKAVTSVNLFSKLPADKRHVLTALFQLCVNLLAHASTNKLTPNRLAYPLANATIRSKVVDLSTMTKAKVVVAAFETMIAHADYIFGTKGSSNIQGGGASTTSASSGTSYPTPASSQSPTNNVSSASSYSHAPPVPVIASSYKWTSSTKLSSVTTSCSTSSTCIHSFCLCCSSSCTASSTSKTITTNTSTYCSSCTTSYTTTSSGTHAFAIIIIQCCTSSNTTTTCSTTHGSTFSSISPSYGSTFSSFSPRSPSSFHCPYGSTFSSFSPRSPSSFCSFFCS